MSTPEHDSRRGMRHLGLWVALAPFVVMLVTAFLFAADLVSLMITLLTIGASSFMGFVGGMLWQANR